MAFLVAGALSEEFMIQRSFPVYKQCDNSWGMDKLGSSGKICRSGCLVTALSSGLSSFGIKIYDSVSTPNVVNRYLMENEGYLGNTLVWTAVENFGFTYNGQTSEKETIVNNIKQQKLVLLNVRSGAHWVLATGFNDEGYIVMDSGFIRSTYSFSEVVRAATFSKIE